MEFVIILFLLFLILWSLMIWFIWGLGGKSAILTALCVAFGSRAKSTERAATMKDFIKNGCRYVECYFV